LHRDTGSGSAPPPAESRASRGADAKRSRILAAARDLCASKGFDATRMEEIAAAAGVSKGTLYNFFESKDDLVAATILQAYADHHLLVPLEMGRASGPLERLDALLCAMQDAFAPTAALMPLHFQAWALVVRDPALRQRLFAALRPIYADNARAILETLEQARAKGLVSDAVDLESLTRACIATFDGLLYRSTFDPQGASRETLRAALAAVLEPVLMREARR